MNTVIHFEDHGQDFLTWEVNSEGVVVDCQPFQAFAWCGRKVSNLHELAVGTQVKLDGIKPGDYVLKYPIESITRPVQIGPTDI